MKARLHRQTKKLKMAKKRSIQEVESSNQSNAVQSKKKKTKKGKWTNKQRVLVFCSRGISHRARHLMLDVQTLLPHSKSETKLDRKDKLFVVNEVCEMKNCNKCVFFEMRKGQDLFMWFSCTPHGPSAKFLVENVHTMDELKLTGNSLKGSRPILSFDKIFDETPQHSLLKEMFIQKPQKQNDRKPFIAYGFCGVKILPVIGYNKHSRHILGVHANIITAIFSTPCFHPKSKPFVDHILSFSIEDNRIWFRNFQIVEEDGSLLEIGPRFVLNLIRVFEGSFGGSTLYENPQYQSPNEYRRMVRKQAAQRYRDRVESRLALEGRRETNKDLPRDIYDVDDVFHTITQSDIDIAKARQAGKSK